MIFNNVSHVRHIFLTLKLSKVCLFERHLSGEFSFCYWVCLKNVSARKITTLRWPSQWCHQLPWFCGKSPYIGIHVLSKSKQVWLDVQQQIRKDIKISCMSMKMLENSNSWKWRKTSFCAWFNLVRQFFFQKFAFFSH